MENLYYVNLGDDCHRSTSLLSVLDSANKSFGKIRYIKRVGDDQHRIIVRAKYRFAEATMHATAEEKTLVERYKSHRGRSRCG